MTVLFTWLWQGLAIATLTWVGLRCMRHLNAANRHVIWWLALVAVVLLPIVQTGGMLLVQAPGEPAGASALVVVPAMPDGVISAAIAIWLAAAIAGTMRIAAGVRLLVRLKRLSRPFDSSREARLSMWTSVRGSGRAADLRVADVACAACTLGLGHPTILIGERIVTVLDDDELDQIVMHEHAHLARFDDWSRLAQAAITAVAGLHPAVRFINRQIDREREMACDESVVSRTGAATRYAACLADAAAASIGSFEAAVIPRAIGARATLAVRIGRLLEPGRHRTARVSRGICVGGAVLFIGIVIVSSGVRPVVMFLDSRSAHGHGPEAVATPSVDFRRAAISADREPVLRRAPALARFDASRSQSDRSPKGTGRAAPGTVVRITSAPAVETAEATPLLAARRLEHEHGAPASLATRPARAPASATKTMSSGPWNRASDAGLALGGFFARGGTAIARKF